MLSDVTASFVYREPGLWDLRSGTHLYNLPPQTAGVQATAMTDFGRLAITGSTSPSLQIWDVLSPPVSHTTRLHTEDITSVALSGCGGLGVCASRSGSICVFDADTMTIIQQLQPHSAAVSQVLGYKDVNKLFSTSADGTICLWNGETGEILTKFEEQESPVNCLAITTGRDLLMTGGGNGEVAFWNIDTGKKLKTFSDHTSGVLAVAFIKQKKDQFMFSISKDGVLCIREFRTAKVVVSTRLNTGELVSTAIAPNATFMVCGSKEGPSYITSLPLGTLTATLIGHSAAVSAVKVSSDSTKCVTGSADCTIRVWSITDTKCRAVLYVDAPVLACDVNYNMIILYGTEDGWVFTAAFQSNLSKPNALIRQLDARDSPTNASSSIASANPLDSRVEGLQGNKSHGEGEETTDHSEEHLPPSNKTYQENETAPPITQPEDAANGKPGFQNKAKPVLNRHGQNGEITHGLSIDSITTSKLITAGVDNISTTSNRSVKANSSACTLL